MRRLPIYFLVDVSESMVGGPIDEVQNGMRTIIQELRMDPYALETAFVSVIAFAGKAETLSPLTELYKFYPPTFPIGGGTSLGVAMDYLMNEFDSSIQKTTLEVKGDWKPIIFLFTDGNPTDNYQSAFARWNAQYRRSCNLVAISIGDNVNTQMLGQLSDNVYRIKDTDASSFKQFFKWVTASIKATSVSVTDYSNDELKLPSTSGINLEKVDTNQVCTVYENYVVLHGKCQNTKQDYLVKYAKRSNNIDVDFIDDIYKDYFKLVGTYAINGDKYEKLSEDENANRSINTKNLIGNPICPCCGNQSALVLCGCCGNISCVGEDMRANCPWCGCGGTVDFVDEMSVTRGRG